MIDHKVINGIQFSFDAPNNEIFWKDRELNFKTEMFEYGKNIISDLSFCQYRTTKRNYDLLITAGLTPVQADNAVEIIFNGIKGRVSYPDTSPSFNINNNDVKRFMNLIMIRHFQTQVYNETNWQIIP